MRFQNSEVEGWYYKLDDDGNKVSPSFKNTGDIGRRLWVEMQGWIADGNTPDPYVEPKQIITESGIRARYASLMEEVAYPYSEQERETWFKQQRAYEVFEADGTILPYIQTMAGSRGIDVVDLLNKIGENIALYDQAIFDLLGKQQKELDELASQE